MIYQTAFQGACWLTAVFLLSLANPAFGQDTPLSVTPSSLDLRIPQSSIVPSQPLSVSASDSQSWSVHASARLRLSAESGSGNGGVDVEVLATDLEAGTYLESVTFFLGQESITIPVTLHIEPLRITRLKAAQDAPYVLALSSPNELGKKGFLLKIDASDGKIVQFCEVGPNPSDFSEAPVLNRVYTLSTGGHPSPVVHLEDWKVVNSLTYPTNTNTIQASPSGLLAVGGDEVTPYLWVINPTSGEVVYRLSSTRGGRPRLRPMVFSPDGQFLYALDRDRILSKYSFADQFLKKEGTRRYGDDTDEFRGDLLITTSGDALFYQHHRTTSALFDTYQAPDRFQPVAIDPDGIIAIGEDEIRYARSGEFIANLDFTSNLAAVTADSHHLVRYSETRQTFVSRPVADFLALPGTTPQPGEDLFEIPETISEPPVAGADSYELLLGLDPQALEPVSSSANPIFQTQSLLPGYGKVFWRIDSLRGGNRTEGSRREFEVVLKPETAFLGSVPNVMRLSEGQVSVSAETLFQEVEVWAHPVLEPLPGALEPVASLTPGSPPFLESNSHHGFAGGDFYTNKQDEVQRYQVSPEGYRLRTEVPNFSKEGFRILSFVSSGNFFFISRRNDVPRFDDIRELSIYRAYPDPVLEQEFRPPPEDPYHRTFGGQLAAEGDLLVVSNYTKGNSQPLTLWVYRRSHEGLPWQLVNRIEIDDSEAAMSRVATDGQRIAVKHWDTRNGAPRVSVYSTSNVNTFSRTWTILAPEFMEGPFDKDTLRTLDIDQGYLAVASPSTFPRLYHRGSIFMFERLAAGNWVKRGTLSTLPSFFFPTPSPLATDLAISNGVVFANGDETIHRFELSPDANKAPHFRSRPEKHAVSGRLYRERIDIADDSQSLIIEDLELPDWMQLEERFDGYYLTGIPPSGPLANTGNLIHLKASDSDGASSHLVMSLVYYETGSPPIILEGDPTPFFRVGEPMILRPDIIGTPPLTYQWFFNGEPVNGTNSPFFAIAYTTNEDAGTYTLSVSDGLNEVTSEPIEVSILPPSREGTQWTTTGGDPSRRSHVPVTLGTHRFSPAWTVESFPSGSNSPPVIANGRIITATTNSTLTDRVRAFELTSGEMLWESPFPSPTSGLGNPTLFGDRVLMTTNNFGREASLRAFNTASGEEIWSKTTRNFFTSEAAPVVDSNGIWLNGGSLDGLQAFTSNGDEVFLTPLPAGNRWAPVLANGKVYSFNQNTLSVFDPVNGVKEWDFELPKPPSQVSMAPPYPAITADAAFLTTRPGTAACVDLETRSIRWLVEYADFPESLELSFRGTPAIRGNTAYYNAGYKVAALNVKTGALEKIFDSPSFLWKHQPIVFNDHLVASSPTASYLFDLETAQLIQTLPAGGPLAYAEGYLVSGGNYATLTAFYANDIPDILTPQLPPILEGTEYAVPITVAHFDSNEVLTFELKRAPGFLNLSTEGILTANLPDGPVPASIECQVEVSDQVNEPVTRSFVIEIITNNRPPLIEPSPLIIQNPITGFYEQDVMIQNSNQHPFNGLKIVASGLTERQRLRNGMNGILSYPFSIPAGASFVLNLRYEAPDPSETLSPELSIIELTDSPLPPGTEPRPQKDQVTSLPDGRILFLFGSVPGRIYRVQYSTDLVTWTDSSPSLAASDFSTSWIGAPPLASDSTVVFLRVIDQNHR